MIRKILIGLLIVLVLLQFIPTSRTEAEGNPANDLIAMTQPPREVRVILEKACYDCHSFKTEYPWYASIAPVSFWINDHIEHGREHLNFSLWGTYDAQRQDHKLEELVEEVEEGEMPLNSYTWAHGDARLSDDERAALVSWAEQLRETY